MPSNRSNPLGAGGMGEVYRARDTRLKRDVALKVLPAELASEPERLERFQAKPKPSPPSTTPTSSRSSRWRRPRTFQIAIPLTEAVSAAHEKRIIHRDLKPGNVMVTEEGRVAPVSVTARKADIPRDLAKLIKHCLEKEPRKRSQSTLDLAYQLEELRREVDTGEALTSGGALVATSRAGGRRRVWLLSGAVVAGVLVLAISAAVVLWGQRQAELPPPAVVQLTWTGRDGGATFSPDGEQIAYASRGGRGEEPGLRLKFVGEAEGRRLATDAPGGRSPSWSPDGKQIALVRVGVSSADTMTIYLMSALGGAERRLLDLPAPRPQLGYQLSWSPDGRWLATARARTAGETTPESGGIHLIPVAGGEPRAVTSPEPPNHHVSPAFSPDGRALAYAACEAAGGAGEAYCDIDVVTLDSDFRPTAPPRKLPGPRRWVQGLTWTPDKRSIVFGVSEIPNTYLWRVRADGTAPPERIDLAGRGATFPSAARGRDRLAFVRNLWDVDLYSVQLGSSPAPVVQSTFDELFSEYSPDGCRIAFQSGRSGDVSEIWLSDADGSDPARLTHGPGRSQGSPCWSPDGRQVAFDSLDENGRRDIWTIAVDGSDLRQATQHLGSEIIPSWSRDGRWIYFSSNRTGRPEVFRVAAAGGPEEQVTHEGGCAPQESLDGRTLYYNRTCQEGPLLARHTTGGEERTIARCIYNQTFAVAPQGVFYVGCSTPEAANDSASTVYLWESATQLARPAATIDGDWIAGLSVTPDGRTLLWGRSITTTDIMMIENFR